MNTKLFQSVVITVVAVLTGPQLVAATSRLVGVVRSIGSAVGRVQPLVTMRPVSQLHAAMLRGPRPRVGLQSYSDASTMRWGTRCAALAAGVAAGWWHGKTVYAEEDLGQALFEAAQSGQVTEIKALLKRGAPVDRRGWGNQTPLHRATNRNVSESIVKILLDKGADPNAQDAWGDTPLHNAVNRGHINIKVVEVLIGAGVRLDIRNKKGQTVRELIQKKCPEKLGWFDKIIAKSHKPQCPWSVMFGLYGMPCAHAVAGE